MSAKPQKMILWRHVRDLGFKSANLFVPALNSWGLFYKASGNNLLFVWQGQGGKFRLSARNAKAFAKGKLSVTPPDCCNASGGETRGFNPSCDSYPIPRDAFLEEARSTECTRKCA